MSLRIRTMLAIILVAIAYVGIAHTVLHLTISKSFLVLEEQEATKDLQRCAEAIENEVTNLDLLAYDWAAWDDTYNFVLDGNLKYVETNLVRETFEGSLLNAVFVVNRSGEVIWGKTIDLEAGQDIELAVFPPVVWPADHFLLRHHDEIGSIAGLLNSEQGPLIVASRPIITSENEGPIRGALIMCRFLNEQLVQQLSEQTRVDFAVLPPEVSANTPAVSQAIPQLLAGEQYVLNASSTDTLSVFAMLDDIAGEAPFVLQASLSRYIAAQGVSAVRSATVAIALGGLLLALVAVLLLHVFVTGRVSQFKTQTAAVSASEDLSLRISFEGRDEIGQLAAEFNHLLAGLERAEHVLEEQATQYRHIVDNIGEGIIATRIDQHGRALFEYANPAAERLYGVESGALIGRRIIDFLEPEQIEIAELELDKRKTGQTSTYDITVRRPNDERRSIVVTATPRLSEAGTFIGSFSILMDITERKIAEEAIRESEQRFRNVVEGTALGMHFYDLRDDGRLVFRGANPASDRILGIDCSQFIGKPIEVAFPPLAETEIPSRYRRAAAEGTSWHSEQVTSEHGEIARAFELDAFQTTPGSMAVMFSDIAKRKRAEAMLQKSEEAYRALVENSQDIIVRFDHKSRLVYASPIITEYTNLSHQDLIGKRMCEAGFPAAMSEFIENQIQTVFASGTPIEIEVEWTTPEDKLVIFNLRLLPEFDDEGSVATVLGIARDITKEKQAAIAIRESEERFRRAIVDAPLPIMIHAEDGEIIQLNERWTDLTGYTHEDIPTIGEWTKKAHGKRRELVRSVIDEMVKSESHTSEGIFHIQTAQGETLAWDFSSSQLGRLPDGRQLLISMAMDVTERERLEQQLRQAQKMEAIGLLAGGIAHDFNNVIFAILGNADIALESIEEHSPLCDNLREIITAGNRAADLVKQILTFARQAEKKRQQIDTLPIVKEVAKLMRSTLPANIEVAYSTGLECADVIADPTEIHQILMNLCTNAGQAMMETGGKLEISVRSVKVSNTLAKSCAGLTPGLHLLLSVKDTGQGIAPEVQERVFEPYFTTKSIGKGTGMGLAVVHGIVTDLGGTIRVHSNADQGTVFDVYLPAASTAEKEARDDTGALPRGSESVLVVDDEQSITNMVKHMLMGMGYEVTAFTNSTEALAAFRAEPNKYDVVITDQAMPGITGSELAQELLQLRSDLPIVLCTGFSETFSEDRARSLGIRAYVLKPLTRRVLAETIRRVLDQSKP